VPVLCILTNVSLIIRYFYHNKKNIGDWPPGFTLHGLVGWVKNKTVKKQILGIKTVQQKSDIVMTYERYG